MILTETAPVKPEAPHIDVTYTKDSPVKGPANAPVTVIEFTDFQCPFCGRNFQQTYPQIYNDYVKTGKVKYISRNFPLESIHPFAFKAAEAAQCAAEQGKYWEMHDLLFGHQKELATLDLTHLALQLGLEIYRFQSSLDDEKIAREIREDFEGGRQSGVRGTQTFAAWLQSHAH